MELPRLVPRRWQEQRWWRPLGRSLVLAVFLPTLVWGTWLRVEQCIGVAEGLAEGRRMLEPDPSGFYDLARQMHHPYQSGYREPVQIGLIKVSMMFFGERPSSVLIPTLVASVALIVVVFWVGRAIFSLPVGLAAAALVAFNHHLIRSAAKGYRLELFAGLVLVYVCVLFACERWGLRKRLLVAGVLGGLLLLVRITTLTLLVPALAFFVWREYRRTARLRKVLAWSALSLVISLALLAPYLVECWRVYGRPLWAIDCHAQWWTDGEAGRRVKSRPEETTITVFEYLFGDGRVGRTALRSAQGYWIVARMLPWYAGNWKLLLPFALAGMVMTAVRRERYLLWCAFWVALPFTVVMPLEADVRLFMFLLPLYLLWAVVGVYPFAFGVLYYVTGGKVAEWAESTQRAPLAEVLPDEQPQEPRPGD